MNQRTREGIENNDISHLESRSDEIIHAFLTRVQMKPLMALCFDDREGQRKSGEAAPRTIPLEENSSSCWVGQSRKIEQECEARTGEAGRGCVNNGTLPKARKNHAHRSCEAVRR